MNARDIAWVRTPLAFLLVLLGMTSVAFAETPPPVAETPPPFTVTEHVMPDVSEKGQPWAAPSDRHPWGTVIVGTDAWRPGGKDGKNGRSVSLLVEVDLQSGALLREIPLPDCYSVETMAADGKGGVIALRVRPGPGGATIDSYGFMLVSFDASLSLLELADAEITTENFLALSVQGDVVVTAIMLTARERILQVITRDRRTLRKIAERQFRVPPLPGSYDCGWPGYAVGVIPWRGQMVVTREGGVGFEALLLPQELGRARASFVEFIPQASGMCRSGQVLPIGDRMIAVTRRRVVMLGDGLRVERELSKPTAWLKAYQSRRVAGEPAIPLWAMDPESGRIVTEDASYARDVEHEFRPAFHLEHRDVSGPEATVPHLTDTVEDLFWAFGRAVFFTAIPGNRWVVLSPRDST